MTKQEAHLVATEVMREFGVTPAQWRFMDRPVRLEFLSDDSRGGKRKKEIHCKRSWSSRFFKEKIKSEFFSDERCVS
jgi:hypothetical protein